MKAAPLRPVPAAETKAARNPRQNREKIMAAIRAAAIAEFSENGLKGRPRRRSPNAPARPFGKPEVSRSFTCEVLDGGRKIFVPAPAMQKAVP
jgi:hypothetical protein